MIFSWQIITDSSQSEKTGKIPYREISMLNKSQNYYLSLLFFLLLFATSCGVIKSFQPTSTPTLIPPPAATATPLPDRVILVAADGTDNSLVSEAQQLVGELAASSGYVFESRKDITQSEITPDIKIIVFLHHPENLGALSNAARGTQFVVLSDLNWNPGSNVTVIRRKAESIAFIAGFISVNLNNNFRGGALLLDSDTVSQQAFTNGGHYFCGLCSPSIPPYIKYPLVATQPAGSSPSSWQAAFDQMYINGVRVLYVAPEAYSPELFTYLVGREITLFGSQTPLDAARPRWATTLSVDGLAPLREIWPDLKDGKGGKIVYGGVRFSEVQPAFISPGKLEYFQKTVELIRSGLLNPLSAGS